MVDLNHCRARREQLLSTLRLQESVNAESVVLLVGNWPLFEAYYRQDPNFYYFIGSQEPSTFAVLTMEGDTTLYIPHTGGRRAQWEHNPVECNDACEQQLDVESIEYVGEELPGYSLPAFFSPTQIQNLINRLTDVVENGGTIYAIYPQSGSRCFETQAIISRVVQFIEGMSTAIEDISPFISAMRRIKSHHEVEEMYKAVEITMAAHYAASQVIQPGVSERIIQAAIEYHMTAMGGSPAYGTIVGSGSNATVLHYRTNNAPMQAGDLVLIDAGAQLNGYCADLTRTYPVSGTMSERQLELYSIVLEAQQYIANMARPGMYLRNGHEPEKSLHHLCVNFFKDRGLDRYFPHGVGHYLGLEVHDVGDYGVPLQDGDIITIEPGLYLPEERIGIRIEDNYWVTKESAVCISAELPKEPGDVEDAMREQLFGE